MRVQAYVFRFIFIKLTDVGLLVTLICLLIRVSLFLASHIANEPNKLSNQVCCDILLDASKTY